MNDKALSFLIDWTINFIKNKDIISKKIEKIDKNKDGFDLYVKYRDKEQYFIIIPQIVDIDSIIQKINDNFYISIVILNSKQNFEIIVKNWKRFIDFKVLSIIFVNPFSDWIRNGLFSLIRITKSVMNLL